MSDEKPLYDSGDPRIYFAAERTLLAWVRTGLSLMGFGFVVARFGLFLREMAVANHVEPRGHSGWSLWMGTSLVALGVVVNVTSALRHQRTIRRLRHGETVWPNPLCLETVIAGMLALFGIAMVAYLFGI